MSRMVRTAQPDAQRGAATIEFSLVLIFAFTLLFAVIEVGRLVWTLNVAVTATREGARMASTCDQPDATAIQAVRQRVSNISLGAISAADVEVEFPDPEIAGQACTTDTCQFVRVSLRPDTRFTSVISLVPLSVPLPPFTATARREAMSATCN